MTKLPRSHAQLFVGINAIIKRIVTISVRLFYYPYNSYKISSISILLEIELFITYNL